MAKMITRSFYKIEATLTEVHVEGGQPVFGESVQREVFDSVIEPYRLVDEESKRTGLNYVVTASKTTKITLGMSQDTFLENAVTIREEEV